MVRTPSAGDILARGGVEEPAGCHSQVPVNRWSAIWKRACAVIEERIEAKEKALVLIDLRHYEGAHDLHTAWQELKLVTHYADMVDKIAVVGSLDWQKLATRLVSPFTRARERFFEPDEVDDAAKWLRA